MNIYVRVGLGLPDGGALHREVELHPPRGHAQGGVAPPGHLWRVQAVPAPGLRGLVPLECLDPICAWEPVSASLPMPM